MIFFLSFCVIFFFPSPMRQLLFALGGFGTEAASVSGSAPEGAMYSQDCGPFGQSCGQPSALRVMPSAL